jgi:hypothetical protein
MRFQIYPDTCSRRGLKRDINASKNLNYYTACVVQTSQIYNIILPKLLINRTNFSKEILGRNEVY